MGDQPDHCQIKYQSRKGNSIRLYIQLYLGIFETPNMTEVFDISECVSMLDPNIT